MQLDYATEGYWLAKRRDFGAAGDKCDQGSESDAEPFSPYAQLELPGWDTQAFHANRLGDRQNISEDIPSMPRTPLEVPHTAGSTIRPPD